MARKHRIHLSRQQRELRRRYGGLFEDVSELLFRFDPAGLNFGSNRDEYDGETEQILPRLASCRSAEDVDLLLRQVFSRDLLGPAPRLTGVSVALWRLWLGHHGDHVPWVPSGTRAAGDMPE